MDQNIKIPFITTLHGTDITLVGKDPSFEPVINFSINHSNSVTAVSKSLKKETEKLFKVQKKINVIPNFICTQDYQLVNNDFYKKRFAPNNEKIICHISNFRKVKRIQDVLAAFEIISKKIAVKLILVGDGPERSSLERLSRKSVYSNHIHYLGSLKSTKEVLNISDIFFLPSLTESFGLSALEAMACSVPVISTKTGGIPEVVVHGESGMLSNVGDFKNMANNALKMLSNEHQLNKFKANALKQAQKFDVKKILPLYEKLYEDCIEGHFNK